MKGIREHLELRGQGALSLVLRRKGEATIGEGQLWMTREGGS